MEKDLKKDKKNKTDLSKLLGEVLAKRASEKKLIKFILIEVDISTMEELKL